MGSGIWRSRGTGLRALDAAGTAEAVQGLATLQSYYARAAAMRGYGSESPRDCLLLLTEEVGELARAIRKSAGLVRHGSYADADSCAELADVQLYVVHLANVLGVDLGRAVAEKDAVNAARARRVHAQA